MSVFADAHKGHVYRGTANLSGHFGDDFPRVTFSAYEMVTLDPNSISKPVQQLFSKTRRMRDWNAEILIQMEQLHALPINFGISRELIEKFELGRAGGRNDSCRATLTNSIANCSRRLRSCGVSE